MRLIIEGMDRCGKSTLINDLRRNVLRQPGLIVHHSVSPPGVQFKNVWELRNYRDLIDNTEGRDVIFDRFHLGAYVYGTFYRGQSETIIEDIEEGKSNFVNTTFLVMLTDYPVNIHERDDGNSIEGSLANFEETHLAFERAFDKSKIVNKMKLNITEIGGFKSILPKVKEFLWV